MKKICILVLIVLGWTSFSFAADTSDESIPRGEHPRPDFMRENWLNLNGTWQFEIDNDDNGRQRGLSSGKDLADSIVVPFCPESKLSGIGNTDFMKNVWYRRHFSLTDSLKGKRLLLHFQAADYLTNVWLNGRHLGQHMGSSSPFVFEVTGFVREKDNELVVHIFDDTRSGLQPSGKQCPRQESFGCLYTRTTGIWQTVWLEAVGTSYISDFRLVPDPKNSRVLLQVEIDGQSQGMTVTARAYAKGKQVGTASSAAAWRNTQLVLDLDEKHLWSPKNPFLYDLEITVSRDKQIVDTVKSYFGLRTVTIEGSAILINGQPIFQRLVLDQGFYPDGIWTAPTDAALRGDIELSQAVGFNGARLHQKVFEPRFLYWADKLGYLVWGEFDNWGLNYNSREIDVPVIQEWREILRRDRNHPSIIGWCPFNETPGTAGSLQQTIVALTRVMDPTRPVIETSGWTHTMTDAELLDMHDYNQDPASFRKRWFDYFNDDGLNLSGRYGIGNSKDIPFFLSEYGGIGWFEAGQPAWGYGQQPEKLESFYQRYKGLTDALLDNRNMFGFCYTQLTDIEQERNGIYYYDRRPKFDPERLHAITSRTAKYETDPPLNKKTSKPVEWKVMIGAVPDKKLAKQWRYTIETPDENWTQEQYDDSGWKLGYGGFGKKAGLDASIKTAWTTPDIYLRRQFQWNGDKFDKAALVLHYDNATKIYLNGREVWSAEGWNNQYAGFDITEAIRQAIRQGLNTIAVHTHQDTGGQFIDLALLLGYSLE